MFRSGGIDRFQRQLRVAFGYLQVFLVLIGRVAGPRRNGAPAVFLADQLDNIFVERLWRSVKYEEVYLKQYQSMPEARTGLAAYFRFFNEQRPHQALQTEPRKKSTMPTASG